MHSRLPLALLSLLSGAFVACSTGHLDVGSDDPTPSAPGTSDPSPTPSPTPTAAPAPTSSPTPTPTPTSTKVLLFGGIGGVDADVPLNDTWTFDGTQWTQVNVVGPSGRGFAFAAPLGSKVVMFGGENPNTAAEYDETWTFDAATSTWTNLDIPGPRARSTNGMVSIGDQIVLYGGGADDISGDTWTFDGTKWTEHAIPGPAARNLTGMTSLGGKAVVFGGQLATTCQGSNPCPGFVNDTWTFDGTSWTELTTASAPPARCDFTFAAVGARQAMVYGGRGVNSEINDTWTFDGASWNQISVAPPTGTFGVPNAPSSAPLGDKAVFFGGAQSTPQGDTFEFANNAWSLVDLTAHPFVPAARTGGVMAPLP